MPWVDYRHIKASVRRISFSATKKRPDLPGRFNFNSFNSNNSL